MSRTLVHQRKTRHNTRKQTDISDKGNVIRARSRLLFAHSTVIQHRTKMRMKCDSSIFYDFVFAVFARILSRQDFFTSLKIYHLINFMTSYFSLLSSCSVHIIVIFVCVCLFVFKPHLFSFNSKHKTFPIRCSVLYVIFFRVWCGTQCLICANTAKKLTTTTAVRSSFIIFTKIMI